MEIDFFIRYENVATAVEVKSAENTKAKSLTSVINNWNVIYKIDKFNNKLKNKFVRRQNSE